MIVEKLNTGITFIADKVPSAKSACIGFSVRADVVQTAIKNTSTWLVDIAPKYKKKIDEINKRLQININQSYMLNMITQ